MLLRIANPQCNISHENKNGRKNYFHPFPIPEQTMQQNNTFREFHLSYIEKEGVLFARNKFGAKTRNRSSS
jgi:hypothetical protein